MYNTVEIYGIRSLSNQSQIIYVGQTYRNIEIRFKEHLKEAKNSNLPFYIVVRNLDFKINIISLEKQAIPQLAEKEWISKLKELGHPLLNISTGGNAGYRMSIISRLKNSKANINRPKTLEQRKKMSIARKQYYANNVLVQSDEHKNKNSKYVGIINSIYTAAGISRCATKESRNLINIINNEVKRERHLNKIQLKLEQVIEEAQKSE